MASIFFCDRTENVSSGRVKCDDVQLSEKVYSFKEKVSKLINKPEDNIELVYCGRLLKDEESLDSFGVKAGSTITLIKKSKPIYVESIDPASSTEIRQIIATLQGALANPAYRPTIDSLVNSPEALHEIVSVIPGLDADPSTLALFQDQQLLLLLAHPGNMKRIVEAHPSFLKTAKMIAAAVHEAGSRNDIPATSAGTYSLDQMSDDEDISMNTPAASGGQRSGGGINQAQLAAALAAASGTMPVNIPTPRNNVGDIQTSSRPIITSEFFLQAMHQAQNAALQGQIQQLREMGITDENVARQALQATNGDLQAAIDLIFGGPM